MRRCYDCYHILWPWRQRESIVIRMGIVDVCRGCWLARAERIFKDRQCSADECPDLAFNFTEGRFRFCDDHYEAYTRSNVPLKDVEVI